MKRFSFRLQRVLDIKGVVQELRERELRTANHTLRTEENILDNMEEQLGYYQQTLRKRLEKPVTPIDLMTAHRHLYHLDMSTIGQKQKIGSVRKIVNKCMKMLSEAYGERRILERYKERCRDEYRQEFERDEQAQIDEIISSRHGFSRFPTVFEE